MEIPEGEHPCCAADMFEYDDTKKLNLRQFFSHYKDQFPMLIVIIGGHYGETKFDCYDNFQVLRINCYSAQPRVIAEDPRLDPSRRKGFITIPENTTIKYRLIKGHTKLGNPQMLRDLLDENDRLPLLVQMACDPQYPIRVGNSRHLARDFGHIMIKEKYMEHFFLMNAIDGVRLQMNKFVCMACLCEELEATPVTGFKYGSKAEFDEFCRKLSQEVEQNGQIYDRTKGNEDYSEYSFDEMRYLIEISDYSAGLLTDGAEAEESEEHGDYEDIPPELPTRKPALPRRAKVKTNAESSEHSSQSHNSPKSPKLHNKHFKGTFGFLKKKHREEHETVQDKETKETKQMKEVTKPTTKPKPTIIKTQSHDVDSASKCQPREKITQAVLPEVKELPNEMKGFPNDVKGFSDAKGDVKAGYVTLSPAKTYINTQIARATVMPMQKTADECQDKHYLQMQIQATCEDEDEDYETILPYKQKNTKSVKAQRGKQSPLVTELQQKIVQERPNTIEEEDDDNGNYEVVGELDNEDYLVPTQHTQNPPHGQNPNDSESKANHYYANDIKSLTINDVVESLKALNLDKYSEDFKENRIDGEILVTLSIEDFTNELGLKKLEAIRLHKFAKTGHIPK